MKEGDVALTPLPQADGLIKNRPVILLVLKLQLLQSGGWEPIQLDALMRNTQQIRFLIRQTLSFKSHYARRYSWKMKILKN